MKYEATQKAQCQNRDRPEALEVQSLLWTTLILILIIIFMTIYEYAHEMEELLSLSSYHDISLNGIQIGCEDRPLKKVGFAVDAAYDTIDKAVSASCDILLVHHGLFWGSPIAIDGAHYRRVKRALDGSMMLFASHIPLDANIPYGNNAQIALTLGMKEFDGFGEWQGKLIGVKGNLPFPMTMEEIMLLLKCKDPVVIPGCRKDRIERVAIVSGSGSSDVKDAIKEGVDLFITGEIHHEVYHEAMENNLGVLAFGHYSSETFGVKALKRLTEKKYGVETLFIESETGL